jgi:hypothetical protein
MDNLIEQTESNNDSRVSQALEKCSGPTCMYRIALRTSVSLYPQCLRKTLEIPLCKAMTPQPLATALWAICRLRPRISFPELKKPLYIYSKM